tara:strand:- start:2241 stop:2846 length:606 start_codon:yes stop_codon:yes gene_type:complete
MIIVDPIKLKNKCENVSSIEEGEKIAAELLKELSNSKTGVGLAANQIGINKRVCVVNITEPLYFINPRIVETDGEIIFNEGCLSFPNRVIRTKRAESVTIECDNMGKVQFGPGNSGNDEEDYLKQMEAVCVQHEIDHLDGLTMFDKEFKQAPIVREGKKYGRNEKIVIEKNSEKMTLKYKKAEPFLSDGWVIREDNMSVSA